MRQYVTALTASMLGLAWGTWIPAANAGLVDEAVVFYDFEGTGQKVTDRSGTPAINLTLGSTAIADDNDPTRAVGEDGKFLAFERATLPLTDSATNVVDNNRLNFKTGDAFSVAGWFRRRDSGKTNILVSKADNNTEPVPGWHLLWQQDGSNGNPFADQIQFLLRDTVGDASDGRLIVHSDPVTSTGWVHIAATYDGTASTTSISFYIDGELKGVPFSIDSLEDGAVTNHTAPFNLGGRNKEGSFQGDMDDVGVWDRALTAGEVRSLIIPEPAAAVLVGVGGVLLLCRRSRV